MVKEIITERMIKEDAEKYIKWQVDKKEDTAYMDSYFMYPLIFCPVVWIMFGWIFGVLSLAAAALLFVPYLKQRKKLKKEIAWAEGLELEVRKEALISTYTEEVYEPHYHKSYFSNRQRRHNYKRVTFLCFSTGKWRVPEECYAWSKELKMSSEGVENSSVPGDEFWVVTVKGGGDVCAAYNTKFFKYVTE
ncbi:MAG: hypothetical protein IIX69_06395 [Clostridia bacterium]|nr:hypothetical protein [Clostridia bacterium]